MPTPRLARGVLFHLLFPACFFVAQASAAAQFSVEPEIGFHGLFQLGRAFPLRVAVGNAGPPATAEVEVSVWKRSAPPSTEFYPVRYRKEIVLPAHSRKTAVFSIDPGSLSRPLEIRFFHPREKVVLQVDLRRHFSPAPLVLVVADRELSPILPATFKNPVVRLSLRELPAEARSYGGVMAVLFYEQSLRDFSEAQTAALESWLLSGGRMVILGSLHYALYQEPTLSRFLPVRVKGSRRVRSASGLESAYGEGAGALNDLWVQESDLIAGNVLLSEGGIPILVRQQRGKGEIVYLSADAGRPPLSRWSGLGPLFADLLRPPAAVESPAPAVWDHSVVSPLLSGVYFSRVPLGPFFFWLGLYLAGAGLWIFFWRKLTARRRGLLVVFFLFLASVSAAGYVHIDRSEGLPDGVLLTARLFDGLPGGYVEVQSNVALFSSRAGSYEIAVESGWSDVEMSQSALHQPDGAPVLLRDELDAIRFSFPLKAWDYRLFRLRSVWRFPLQADARRHGKTALVKLVNQSAREIRDGWLLLFGEPFYWGSLPPGAVQEREFSLEPAERARRKTALKEIRFDDRVREILFRHSFFPGGRETERWSMGALFFGWIQEDLQETRLKDERVSSIRHTLYRTVIPWTGENEEEG